MGAWDSDPFGNDTACDWVFSLVKTNGLGLIEATLAKTLSAGDDYLDASDADEAVAAADAVARLRGHFYVKNAYTKSLDEWVTRQKVEIPQRLVDAAIGAVNRILTEPSELLELWEESGDDEWNQHMADLKERLEQPPAK